MTIAFVVGSTLASSAAGIEKAPRRVEVTKKESEVILPWDKLNLSVKLQGDIFIQETLLVDARHTVYLPDLGRISIQGMVPSEASDLIAKKYQERLYPGTLSTVSYQRVFKNLSVDEGR